MAQEHCIKPDGELCRDVRAVSEVLGAEMVGIMESQREFQTQVVQTLRASERAQNATAKSLEQVMKDVQDIKIEQAVQAKVIGWHSYALGAVGVGLVLFVLSEYIRRMVWGQ